MTATDGAKLLEIRLQLFGCGGFRRQRQYHTETGRKDCERERRIEWG